MNTIEEIGTGCTGCRSCEQTCPLHCITMTADWEGFLQPQVRGDACIRCGKCLRACPVYLADRRERYPLRACAFQARSRESLRRSSSGGLCDALARAVLARGGVVYGAAFEAVCAKEDTLHADKGKTHISPLTVRHIEVTDPDGCHRLQSSKYVQSDTGHTFSRAGKYLEEGRAVFYTGTPCQIAGLYAFLGEDHENLYTVDLICHGVPSPLLLGRYLAWHSRQADSPVTDVDFRTKEGRGWGGQYRLKITTESGVITRPLALDRYGKHFIASDCYRESCYECRFANMHRPGDLTAGDFWGISQVCPEFVSSGADLPAGISSVLVNTEKGQALLDLIADDALIREVDPADIQKNQGNLSRPTPRPKTRDSIYRNIGSEDYIRTLRVGPEPAERIKAVLPPGVFTFLKHRTGDLKARLRRDSKPAPSHGEIPDAGPRRSEIPDSEPLCNGSGPGGRPLSVAVCVNSLSVNGISTVVMNSCTHLDPARFRLTILAGAPAAKVYLDTCQKYGIRLVLLPERKRSAPAYYCALFRALSGEQYDIFHIHGNSALITPELLIAKHCGIPVRIAHSHNTTCMRQTAHRLLLPLFRRAYTHAFACGQEAGRWMFGERSFQVIPNGFDTSRFRFREELRICTRRRLRIEDGFVIGHIGRFNSQKNQPFLLDVFRCIGGKRKDAYLLLAGTGPDLEQTKEKISRHPYKDRILLCGETDEPEALYAAMDVFVLPSRYEGLPVVLLEAQMNGLMCIVSDAVTKEASLGGRVRWLSLSAPPETWADAILDTDAPDRTLFYDTHAEAIAPYHIQNSASLLGDLYKTMYREVLR